MRFEPIPNLLDRAGGEGADSGGASAGPRSNAIERAPSSLSLFLGPLARLLEDPEVTEICINEPGTAFVERQSGWSREDLPFASYDWCLAIAKLVSCPVANWH